MNRCIRLVMMSSLFCLVWGVTFFTLVGAPVDKTKGEQSKPTDKVRAALDQKLTLDIIEQPLSLAVATLGEKAQINVVLDMVTITNFGIDPQSTPVTYKAKDVKLRNALRTILTPHNLSFAVLGGTLVVSNNEVLEHRQITQRISVDIEKTPLSEALKKISSDTSVNLVLDPRASESAKSPVTLHVDEVPLATAVRLMAIMADLRMLQTGNVLFVTTKETALELQKDPAFNPNLNLIGPAFGELGGGIPGGFGGGLGVLGGGLGALGGGLGALGVPRQ